jgi:hypothetical protein
LLWGAAEPLRRMLRIILETRASESTRQLSAAAQH